MAGCLALMLACRTLGAEEFPWPEIDKGIIFPPDTAELPPRQAAEEFVRANMTREIRAAFDVKFDGSEPPKGLSVLAECTERANSRILFLDTPPRAPALVLATIRPDVERVTAGKPFTVDVPVLVRVPLAAAEAERLAATAVWLDRVRFVRTSAKAPPGELLMPDGYGLVRIRKGHGGRIVAERRRQVWPHAISSLSSRIKTPRAAEETAASLVSAYLWHEARRFAARTPPAAADAAFVRDLLGGKAPYDDLPPDLLRMAAARAGDTADRGAEPLLRALLDNPPDFPTRKSKAELEKELSAIEAEAAAHEGDAKRVADLFTTGSGKVWFATGARLGGKFAAWRQLARARRWNLISDERYLQEEGRFEERDAFTNAVATALVKAGTNTQTLARIAAEGVFGTDWAGERLWSLDTNLYYDVRMALYRRADPDPDCRAALYDRLSPAQALALARASDPDAVEPMTTRFFMTLKAHGAIPDEARRVKALIRVAKGEAPIYGEDASIEAIDLLVPQDDPLHYPAPEIETILRALVSNGIEAVFSPGGNSGIAAMCDGLHAKAAALALVRRDAPGIFELVADKLMPHLVRGGDDGSDCLAALVLVTRRHPEYRPRLLALMKGELVETAHAKRNVFETIFAAGLTELLPQVAARATASAADTEDAADTSAYEKSPCAGHYHVARLIAAAWGHGPAVERLEALDALYGQTDGVLEQITTSASLAAAADAFLRTVPANERAAAAARAAALAKSHRPGGSFAAAVRAAVNVPPPAH